MMPWNNTMSLLMKRDVNNNNNNNNDNLYLLSTWDCVCVLVLLPQDRDSHIPPD